MIVKKLSEIQDSEGEVSGGNWTSRRFLLARDGMGFSLHDTLIHAGTETLIWYRNHLEAVYCIEGEGEVEVLAASDSERRFPAARPGIEGEEEVEIMERGVISPIVAGTMYALDGHERHLLRAKTEMRMICVFNPALTGREVHDKDGVYPAAAASFLEQV